MSNTRYVLLIVAAVAVVGGLMTILYRVTSRPSGLARALP